MAETRWERFKTSLWYNRDLEMMLDTSRALSAAALSDLEPSLAKAIGAMIGLEAGAIANHDEGRMVGHYWLRAPELAPDPEIRRTITDTIDRVKKFTADKNKGDEPEQRFTDFLLIGIGGSALGPQLIADALGDS